MTLFLLWCKQQTTSRKSIARESEWANEWMNGEKNNAVRINFTLNWHFQPIRMQILDPYRCLYTLFASKLESHEIIKKGWCLFSLSLNIRLCFMTFWAFTHPLTHPLNHPLIPIAHPLLMRTNKKCSYMLLTRLSYVCMPTPTNSLIQ